MMLRACHRYKFEATTAQILKSFPSLNPNQPTYAALRYISTQSPFRYAQSKTVV